MVGCHGLLRPDSSNRGSRRDDRRSRGKVKSLKPQERIAYLLKGAQAEGELVYYGTLPIDEFLPLARVFNSRYRSIALHHYFSPRDGILSRTLTEARAGRHAVDVVQVDLSYGYQLLNANLVQP